MKPALRRHYFAIRHNPSGGFLPAVKGYGFTRTRPTLDEPPRLFTKIGPCTQALNYWLEGEHSEDLAFDPSEGSNLIIRVLPRPERRREEMEIVEVELGFRSLSEAELRRL